MVSKEHPSIQSMLLLTRISHSQVPGLNAPIPPGANFGYQAGGWGKPPVNEDGEPLYGDVFGQFADEEDDEQVTRAAPL